MVHWLLPENRKKYYTINEALHIVVKNSSQEDSDIHLRNMQIRNKKHIDEASKVIKNAGKTIKYGNEKQKDALDCDGAHETNSKNDI